MQLRKKTYQVLEQQQPYPALSQRINNTLIALIFISIVVVSLETVPAYYDRYFAEFFIFEAILASIFLIEYLLRLWCVAEKPLSRWKYVLTPAAIVDLLSILAFFLSLLFTWDLKALIILRLLRLLKLVRYFEPLAILGHVFKTEFRAFVSAFLVLLILMIIAATGMYLFEQEAQPELFGSIPQAMWWSIVTLTTLGYGDVVPVTLGGKTFAAIITVLSIGTVALPAGILASQFSEDLKNRKTTYEKLALQLQQNGQLCEISKAKLEDTRQSLNLSESEAQNLVNDICSKAKGYCPYCQQSLNAGSKTESKT
ncbi:MAG: ion transporter [Amphritea sp.]